MLRKFLGPAAVTMTGLLIIAGAIGLSNPREVSAQEPAQIEATVQAIENAWNSKSAFSFRDFWTDQGFESEFGFPRSDIQQLQEFIGDPPITLTATNIVVTDGTATADIALDFGEAGGENSKWTFVLTNGRWLVDDTETIAPEIPEGANVVDVQLDEYEFIYNPASIEAGEDVAFAIENVGQEDHEFVLFRITTDAPLLELLESEEEEPEGIEFVAAADASPGESNVVLAGSLNAGRYGIVCFFPSPDGTPHAFLGMVSEFNLGAGGGTAAPVSPIAPPNTGDGGLLSGTTEGTSGAAILFGALVATLGLFAALRTLHLSRASEDVEA